MFRRAGELEELYKATDWAATPLGDPSTWDAALRMALDLILHTRYPATLLWGPELVLLYNQGYAEMIGDKHPTALGARTEDVFPEAWDVIAPRLRNVLADGESWYVEDELLPLVREGFLEECFFTYSYSPVHGVDRRIEGVIDVTHETTAQVVDRRRLALLAQLQSALTAVDDRSMLPKVIADLADGDHPDLPWIEYRDSASASGSSDRLPVQPATPPTWDDVLVEETGRRPIAWVPLLSASADPTDPPVLVVELNDGIPRGPGYLELLTLIASMVCEAMNRVQLLESERRIMRSERDLSEALQHSLLTTPVQQDGLQVAVRYQPAAHEAQVGGDWYDAFLVGDGALTLAVGDVAGHDRDAAAAMAQVRNLMRAIAYTLEEPPSRIMAALDEAIRGLGVNTTATALLARVEAAGDDDAPGSRLLRWTVAGHLPPVLMTPDGVVRFLDATPDTMLGVLPGSPRHDHEVVLEPGSSVLFFTDGLIERRYVSLRSGMDWLAGRLAGQSGLGAEQLADHVMRDLAPGLEDDIAVLVLRIG